jgi:hypothetical protein
MRDSRGSKTLIKVGKAKDVAKRMSAYKTHNPLARLLETAECRDEKDDMYEHFCHNYFELKGYIQIADTEWYLVPKKTKNYHFEDIEKALFEKGWMFTEIVKYKKNPRPKSRCAKILDTF